LADEAGHVNNISYNRYAETSRINYIRLLANRDAEGNKKRWMDLWTPRGKGLILKNIKTYFKHVRWHTPNPRSKRLTTQPLVYPDTITVLHKIRTLPPPEPLVFDHTRSVPGGYPDKFALEAAIVSETKRRVVARCTEEIQMYDYAAGRKASMDEWLFEALKQVVLAQNAWMAECQAELKRLEDKACELELQMAEAVGEERVAEAAKGLEPREKLETALRDGFGVHSQKKRRAPTQEEKYGWVHNVGR
jgi:hypothetical protein